MLASSTGELAFLRRFRLKTALRKDTTTSFSVLSIIRGILTWRCDTFFLQAPKVRSHIGIDVAVWHQFRPLAAILLPSLSSLNLPKEQFFRWPHNRLVSVLVLL